MGYCGSHRQRCREEGGGPQGFFRHIGYELTNGLRHQGDPSERAYGLQELGIRYISIPFIILKNTTSGLQDELHLLHEAALLRLLRVLS